MTEVHKRAKQATGPLTYDVSDLLDLAYWRGNIQVSNFGLFGTVNNDDCLEVCTHSK